MEKRMSNFLAAGDGFLYTINAFLFSPPQIFEKFIGGLSKLCPKHKLVAT